MLVKNTAHSIESRPNVHISMQKPQVPVANLPSATNIAQESTISEAPNKYSVRSDVPYEIKVPFKENPGVQKSDKQNVTSLPTDNVCNQSSHVTGSKDHMTESDVTVAAAAAGQRLEQMWKFIFKSWYGLSCIKL